MNKLSLLARAPQAQPWPAATYAFIGSHTLSRLLPHLAGVFNSRWPNFTWVNTDPSINKGNYQHWGTYMPGRRLEPNNMLPPENCAGSNTTQGILQTDKTTVIFDGLGGWADRSCFERQIFICEVERKWPRSWPRQQPAGCCVFWCGVSHA